MIGKMLKEVIDSGVKLTPMMAQYVGVKKRFSDSNTILLFRMGDFYEVFFDDAVRVSQILNITLTHRGKLGPFPIPMAGIPHHAAGTYIDRITQSGLKAAICEQVEDPKDAKGIVKRDVTQVVSPGMPFDLDKASSDSSNYLAAVYQDKSHYFLVLVDFTTGDFFGQKFSDEEELIQKLALFSPKEFISYMGQWSDESLLKTFLKQKDILVTYLSKDLFTGKDNQIYLNKIFPGHKYDKIVNEEKNVLIPIAALSYYVCTTQSLEFLHHIRPFRWETEKGKLKVSLQTLVGLEIFPKDKKLYQQSLLGFFDKTKTSMGRRALRHFFLNPITVKDELIKRQNFIQYLIDHEELRGQLQDDLSTIRDVERILAKSTTRKVTGSDLINLSHAILTYEKLILKNKECRPILNQTIKTKEFTALKELATKITKAINDEPGASLDKGNLIKEKYSRKRDQINKLCRNHSEEVLKIEEYYRKKTGIPRLKIKYNNLKGYFIEVTHAFSDKVPSSFNRMQTLTNSERYTTNKLEDFEKEVLTAKEKLYQIEKSIFNEIIEVIIKEGQLLLVLSQNIGLLDVFQSMAQISYQHHFGRPQVFQNKKLFQTEKMWHPLIKDKIHEQFVPHSITLNNEKYFGLITGPNMAGKSTVMREVAIIQYLAQLGSFVPATKSEVGLCDFLFSRLGASDDILKGQSTFMVEMSETAEILRHSTKKSMIILDEIGRGTSTHDGLSIAWALVEHLEKNIQAITLFSTHYHELAKIVSKLPGAKNLTVEVLNQSGDIEFLYNLIDGEATHSFGLYVAKLAGIPKNILDRASFILDNLEENKSFNHSTEVSPESSSGIKNLETVEWTSNGRSDEQDLLLSGPKQLTIFQHDIVQTWEANHDQDPQEKSKLMEISSLIKGIDLINTTPLQAIKKIEEMQKILH